MVKYIFATEEEKEQFKKNVAWRGKTFSILEKVNTTEEDTIVHIGYARGYKLGKGVVIEPAYVMDACTENIIRIDSKFPVESKICMTTVNKNTEPNGDGISLCDDALFRIAELPHKYIHSLKIVGDSSDCCDEAWKYIGILLKDARL